MGMYTELFLQVDLKDNTPEDVIDYLKQLVGEKDIDEPTQSGESS